MEYRHLENTDPLEVEYSGELPDLYTFGIFHLNLQEIIDKVALGLLSQEGLIEPTWRRPRYLPSRSFFLSERIIKAEISKFQIGSLNEQLTFAVALALADPNVIAILQNLGANIIWAIGNSGVRGIKNRIHLQPNKFRWHNRDDDPVEIGPNLREVLLALARNNTGRKAELRIKTSSPNREVTEVVLIVDDQHE